MQQIFSWLISITDLFRIIFTLGRLISKNIVLEQCDEKLQHWYDVCNEYIDIDNDNVQ